MQLYHFLSPTISFLKPYSWVVTDTHTEKKNFIIYVYTRAFFIHVHSLPSLRRLTNASRSSTSNNIAKESTSYAWVALNICRTLSMTFCRKDTDTMIEPQYVWVGNVALQSRHDKMAVAERFDHQLYRRNATKIWRISFVIVRKHRPCFYISKCGNPWGCGMNMDDPENRNYVKRNVIRLNIYYFFSLSLFEQ